MQDDNQTPSDKNGPKITVTKIPESQIEKQSNAAPSNTPTPEGNTLLQVMKQSSTAEEKAIIILGMLYSSVIDKISGSGDANRRNSMEIEKLNINNEMTKWWVGQAKLISLCGLVVASVIVAWKANEKELAMTILKIAFGAIVGFGYKAASSDATK